MDSSRKESCNGTQRYEWDQSYEDLTLYVGVDPETTKRDVSVQFKTNSLQLTSGKGSEGKFRELKGDLFSTVNTSESFWLLQDSTLEVHLSKAKPGEVWEYVFKGDQALSGVEKEEEKKRLLLERFQKEHPRFDFSDAHLNGKVPEPRTFMRK